MAEIKKEDNAEKQQESSKRVVGRPFPPGVSGNPAGRPKGRTIREEIRQYLEDNPDKRDEFIVELIKKYKPLTWQMLEGSPAQQVNLGNAGEMPFLIKITVSTT